jgi:drug/metabolite transporter (DMT)-like permease
MVAGEAYWPPMMHSQQARGAALGLGAAALFGVSAPLAKVLLGAFSPVLLAGLLYTGAALGLWLHRAFAPPSQEARLARRDVGSLAAVVIAGGIAGPVLMLFGLQRVTALTGSLLLNLEAPLTVLLALAAFGEDLGRGALLAALAIIAGAALLELEPGALGGDSWGVLLLAAASACWALDNNLTQRLSLRDPFAIVRVKTLVAGAVNTALGLWIAQRGPQPSAASVLAALALGSLSYGVSVVLDAYALRAIGAAREAAYFATAPFVGALAAVLLLGEEVTPRAALAMLVMAGGVAGLLRERHSHVHEHEALEHEHLHTHDDGHHQHEHDPHVQRGEPHSHAHRHEPLIHEHRHVPDLHHRHRH